MGGDWVKKLHTRLIDEWEVTVERNHIQDWFINGRWQRKEVTYKIDSWMGGDRVKKLYTRLIHEWEVTEERSYIQIYYINGRWSRKAVQ
jgi:hypothetical protein